MKKSWLLVSGIVLLLGAAVFVVNNERRKQPVPVDHMALHAVPQAPVSREKIVPAHYKTAPSRASLGPTLEPEKFTGLTRDAYRAVKQIPVTIAQLPCYCHCDRG